MASAGRLRVGYREPARIAEFLDCLRAAVGSQWVLTGDEATAPYECDALFHLRQRPLAVALAGNEAEVVAVLQACREFGVALVPRGAGTSLSGGALPVRDGIVLSLNRMKSLSIDATAAQAVAGCGVRNVVVTQAASPHGLFFAPDPSSQAASTIGGNIAENAGGVHCVKYGLMVNNVVGLRMVCGTGELLDLGYGSLDQPGLDLPALIAGSEGLLGLVTQARLRLLPQPARVRVLLAFLPTIQSTCEAVTRIVAAGLVPAGLEVMDQLSLREADRYAPHLGLRADAAAALLCELDGDDATVEDATAAVRAVLAQLGTLEVRQADGQPDRDQLWSARKSILPALLRSAPDLYVADCTVPRRALGRVLERVNQLAADHGIEVAQSFHAGDGNLHPVLRYDSTVPGEETRANALADAIMQLVIEEGGSISGEHGIGTEKLHAMCWQFSADELELMDELRRVFDPHGLLNPGKAIPTLHRCAELGGMRISRGAEPFPDLPRF